MTYFFHLPKASALRAPDSAVLTGLIATVPELAVHLSSAVTMTALVHAVWRICIASRHLAIAVAAMTLHVATTFTLLAVHTSATIALVTPLDATGKGHVVEGNRVGEVHGGGAGHVPGQRGSATTGLGDGRPTLVGALM